MGLRKDLEDWAKVKLRAERTGLTIDIVDPPKGEYGDIFHIKLDGKLVRKTTSLAGTLTWVDGFETGIQAGAPCSVNRQHEPASASGESR